MTAKPVLNAISILKRDMENVFEDTELPAGNIRLLKREHQEKAKCQKNMKEKLRNTTIEEEAYRLEITESQISIIAAGDLGFIYGLLYLSEHYLGIKPFWFWMDQKIEKKAMVEIEEGVIKSEIPAVCFRGWFLNDEVLMLKWKYNEEGMEGWKMALEALLRCGGNMVIPGTDKMSRKNRKMASEMGLWLTHHHAEPLGAELLVRAYPDIEPNYRRYAEKFEKLWEEAVLEQKDYKVVWNVCFRGQGDAPFWCYDTTGEFDTADKRGRMISDIIKKQCDIVKQHVKNPVFCTNLYGEIMELYTQGKLELEDSIIKIRADNGFGKMVSRRQDFHNPRIDAMPDKNDSGVQGIYYHVSFYDLQAANHITMMQNSVDFVDKELSQVLSNGGDDFWVINCSNVRPHVYYLDVIRKKWYGRKIGEKLQAKEFAEDYYGGNKEIAKCYAAYSSVIPSFGNREDEHAGEQFYTENIRLIAHQFMKERSKRAEELSWFANQDTLEEQTAYFSGICEKVSERQEEYFKLCSSVAERIAENGEDYAEVFKSTLGLHALIHYYCSKGVVLFGKAMRAYQKRDYVNSFLWFGNSAECFDYVNEQMRSAEYGVWKDFYLNDCFADVKHTAYMIRKIMGVIRELGDNSRHDGWYREYCYDAGDKKVFLLLVTDNHMTDWELYQVMKEEEVKK